MYNMNMGKIEAMLIKTLVIEELKRLEISMKSKMNNISSYIQDKEMYNKYSKILSKLD